jgi:hypothetical protein
MAVELSLGSLYNNLKKMNMSYKVITKRATENDEDLRQLFMMEMMEFDTDQLVFIDETGYNRHTMRRTRGRSIKGNHIN